MAGAGKQNTASPLPGCEHTKCSWPSKRHFSTQQSTALQAEWKEAEIESETHRMAWDKRDLNDHLVQPPSCLVPTYCYSKAPAGFGRLSAWFQVPCSTARGCPNVLLLCSALGIPPALHNSPAPVPAQGNSGNTHGLTLLGSHCFGLFLP